MFSFMASRESWVLRGLGRCPESNGAGRGDGIAQLASSPSYQLRTRLFSRETTIRNRNDRVSRYIPTLPGAEVTDCKLWARNRLLRLRTEALKSVEVLLKGMAPGQAVT